jgi:hypothetical protein
VNVPRARGAFAAGSRAGCIPDRVLQGLAEHQRAAPDQRRTSRLLRACWRRSSAARNRARTYRDRGCARRRRRVDRAAVAAASGPRPAMAGPKHAA